MRFPYTPQGANKCYHQRRRSISVLDHRFHRSFSKLFIQPTSLAPWGFAETQIAEFQHRETRYQLMLALEMSASFIRGALAFTSSSHGVNMNSPLFMEQNKGWLHTRCPICGVHFYKHQKNWSLGFRCSGDESLAICRSMLAANAEQLSSSQPATILDFHRRFFGGMFEGDRVVTVDFGVPNMTQKPSGLVEKAYRDDRHGRKLLGS